MRNPLTLFKRLAPIDLLMFTVLFGVAIGGVLLIVLSRNTATETGTEPQAIPIVKEVAGRPVEPIDREKPVAVDNPQAVKDELLVIISNQSNVSQFGDKIHPVEGLPNTYRLEVIGPESLTQKQDDVRKKAGVESVEPNEIAYVSQEAVTEPSKAVARADQWQWGLDRTKGRDAWPVTQGSGVVVAVIDSGVRGDHEALNGRTIKPKSFIPKDSKGIDVNKGGIQCLNSGSALSDVYGHGTSVASIIASRASDIYPSGVAPMAMIMPVQSFGCDAVSTTEWVAQGIRYAADNGANVINFSGYIGSTQCARVMTDAVQYALSRNVVVVAASGNAGVGTINCPARANGVIAVGASNRENKPVRTSDWGSNWGAQQSVLAPGDDIASACSCLDAEGQPNNRYKLKFYGTSASAPIVAGVAALVKSANPSLTPAQIKDVIQKTATSPGGHAGNLPNDQYGYGIVNALEAVKRAQQTR